MGYKINNNPEQINGQGRQTLRIDLDPGTYDSFNIVVQATIQGGAAGVGLLDMIEDVRLYSQAGIEYFDMPFGSATESDLTDVIHDLRPAIVNDETQLISNPNYVAGVQSFATAVLTFPLIISPDESRILEIVFNPIGSDATITGASGDVNVHFETGLPIQEFLVKTPNIKSEANHRVNVEYFGSTIVRVVVDNLAPNSVSSIKMLGGDNQFDLFFDEKSHLICIYHDYAITRQASLDMAALTGVNMPDVYIGPHKNRRFDMDLDTAQRPNVRFYAIASILTAVGGTAGDNTRGNTLAAKRDVSEAVQAAQLPKESV